MWAPNYFSLPNPETQKARDEGFAIAESYLTEITKKFYKEMKKGLLTRIATTSTTSTFHKCNCEFCDV